MPRRGFIPKREVLPDPVYGTVVVTKLINQLMYDGKRGTAQRVCYEAFEMVAEKTGAPPLMRRRADKHALQDCRASIIQPLCSMI